MSDNKNYFSELASIDVSEYTDKKGKFSYLSWPWAVNQLLSKYPDSTWEVKRFGEDELPYQETPAGAFVEVSVTVKGITRSQPFAVLDHKNKPLMKPNAFDVNRAIQRALVKSIALHGLGLYIYAGEDLPPEDVIQMITGRQIGMINRLIKDKALKKEDVRNICFDHFGKSSAGELTESEADGLIAALETYTSPASEDDPEDAESSEEE